LEGLALSIYLSFRDYFYELNINVKIIKRYIIKKKKFYMKNFFFYRNYKNDKADKIAILIKDIKYG